MWSADQFPLYIHPFDVSEAVWQIGRISFDCYKRGRLSWSQQTQILDSEQLGTIESCAANAIILIHGPGHGQVNMAVHQGRQDRWVIQIQGFGIRIIRRLTGMGRLIFPDGLNAAIVYP